MAQVIIRHTVMDYTNFERVFKDDAARRRRLGSKGGRVFRHADAPNDILIVLEWESTESARRFAEGFELHEAMEWATSGSPAKVEVVEEVLETDA